MEENQPLILDSVFTENKPPRRRALLPWWIKTFAWIFMVFGALALACLIMGLFGMQMSLAFYGLETTEPLSVIGLIIIGIAVLKGGAALALWMEKAYAINLAMADAIIGIAVCGLVMIYPILASQEGFKFTFKLELVLLIPYLVKLVNLKGAWVAATKVSM